eukprot:m.42837 g.42837  ORF g.42837 m.42837 type:complete len:280 (+) comp15041_c0_seq1:1985-2824(+)
MQCRECATARVSFEYGGLGVVAVQCSAVPICGRLSIVLASAAGHEQCPVCARTYTCTRVAAPLTACVRTLAAGVMHSVSAIVHSADDAAVMTTPDTLPVVFDTVRDIFPSKEYWLGPCTIATRGTPYGKKSFPRGALHQTAEGGGLARVPLATNDPRQRGCFGAAYTLAVVAKVLTRGGTKCIGLGDIVGDRGIMALELYSDPIPMLQWIMVHTTQGARVLLVRLASVAETAFWMLVAHVGCVLVLLICGQYTMVHAHVLRDLWGVQEKGRCVSYIVCV